MERLPSCSSTPLSHHVTCQTDETSTCFMIWDELHIPDGIMIATMWFVCSSQVYSSKHALTLSQLRIMHSSISIMLLSCIPYGATCILATPSLTTSNTQWNLCSSHEHSASPSHNEHPSQSKSVISLGMFFPSTTTQHHGSTPSHSHPKPFPTSDTVLILHHPFISRRRFYSIESQVAYRTLAKCVCIQPSHLRPLRCINQYLLCKAYANQQHRYMCDRYRRAE